MLNYRLISDFCQFLANLLAARKQFSRDKRKDFDINLKSCYNGCEKENLYKRHGKPMLML